MVETGAMAGPAKLSLFYMHKPGPDRRGGLSATTTSSTAALIDNQGYWVSPNQNNTSTGVTRPYSFLLGWTYGSGIGAIDANNHGYFNDASVVAARLDYAAASNLNVWGSALYAERANVSGWGFGCMILGIVPVAVAMAYSTLIVRSSAHGKPMMGPALRPQGPPTFLIRRWAMSSAWA